MALTKIGRLVDKGIIKDQTNLGTQAADTDEYLLYDASTDSLKSIAASNVTPNETLITGKDALTNPAADDLLLIYDTSASTLKKITRGDLVGAPDVTSVSPTNALTGDGTGNHTFVITGTAFSGASSVLLTSSGSEVAFDTVTVNSSTQITGVIAKSSLSNADEPYGVKVTSASNISDTLTGQINIDAQPIFSTASGSLATVTNGGRASFSPITIFASDPESGGDVTYAIESGSLPSGLSGSSTSSGYVISGTPDAVGSNTTSTFTIRAKDVNSNISDRSFSITIQAPVSQSFTSSGTFSVPAGITSVDVLVVAGGGGGATQHAGGGGAGGLIYRPGFPVTPGGSVSVTVGNGGSNPQGAPQSPTSGPKPRVGGVNGTNGQDSAFGTLTAKGGGYGAYNGSGPGGSGGGGGPGAPAGGTATQPTQPGDSGTYGFGNAGGSWQPTGGSGGGGGGAGAAGQQGPAPAGGGPGGIGRAYTIADGTTSVYYAGGGGGGNHGPGLPQGQGGQGGGGQGGTYTTSPEASSFAGVNGVANRGGGGGGSASSETTAGQGGKGIVIVQY